MSVNSLTRTLHGPYTATIDGLLYDGGNDETVTLKVAKKIFHNKEIALRQGCLDLSGRLMLMDLPLPDSNSTELKKAEIAIKRGDEILLHFRNMPLGCRDIRIVQENIKVNIDETRLTVRAGIKSEINRICNRS